MRTSPENESRKPGETSLVDRLRASAPSDSENWVDDPTLLVSPLGVFTPRPVIEADPDLAEEGPPDQFLAAKDSSLMEEGWPMPQPIHLAASKEMERSSATDGMGNPMAEEAMEWVRHSFAKEVPVRPIEPPALDEKKIWPGTIVGPGGVFSRPAAMDAEPDPTAEESAHNLSATPVDFNLPTEAEHLPAPPVLPGPSFEEFIASLDGEEAERKPEDSEVNPIEHIAEEQEEPALHEYELEEEIEEEQIEEEEIDEEELEEAEVQFEAEEPVERPLFQSWYAPEPPQQIRIPHLGHTALLGVLVALGLCVAGLLTQSAISFHLFGVTTLEKAQNDIHYTIGSMGAMYGIMLLGALIVFPLWWKKGLFVGVHWRAKTAFRLRWRLIAAAGVCFVLALADEVLLPGPANAPIDKLFENRAAAWILFAFGVTVAPFFEEMLFRGFLLPALCTALDWLAERSSGTRQPSLDVNGHPRWSVPAMLFASIITSLPFAGMHAEQTGYSLGPFVLLVVVSLVLCWVRLSTRSLAASVIVHATYNLMLFSLMLIGTNGFQHLDKM